MTKLTGLMARVITEVASGVEGRVLAHVCGVVRLQLDLRLVRLRGSATLELQQTQTTEKTTVRKTQK